MKNLHTDNLKNSDIFKLRRENAPPRLPESVKVLVAKVSRLMQEGANRGEMLSAKAALERIALKHGTSLEALGVLDSRTERLIPLPKYDNGLRAIMLSVLKVHAPDCELYWTGDEYIDKEASIPYIVYAGKFAQYEYAVVTNLLNDYVQGWLRYQNEALVAWINKQGLVVAADKPGGIDSHLSKEDQNRINRIRALAKIADKVDTNKKLKK